MSTSVSAHALIRYAERMLGMTCTPGAARCDQVRELVALGLDKPAAMETLRAWAEPARCPIFDEAEEVYIYRPSLTLVVKRRTVVTVFPAGMVYEEGYYERQRREAASVRQYNATAMAAAFERALARRRP